MSGFLEGIIVDVEEISEQKWKLLKQMDYQGARELFQVRYSIKRISYEGEYITS